MQRLFKSRVEFFAIIFVTNTGWAFLQKRLEGLTEAEIEALLERVEEEKRHLAKGEQVN